VLFFGLFQQLGTSLLIGFFLLFQYSWMHSLYGISYGVLVVILVGYGLTVFCAQLTAMTIYSFTNSNEAVKRILRVVFYGVILVYAASLLIYLVQGREQFLLYLVEALNGMAARLFPVSGWVTQGVFGVIHADFSGLAFGLLLCAVYIACLVILIVKAKQDYYEDVLKTTEMSYSAITAKKSGQIGESVRKNIRVGKIGLRHGEGADAFYYKHLVENRRAKTFLLSNQSLLFVLCIVAFAFFMSGTGGLAAVFAFATYMQLFTVVFGRFPKELTKPYVYLVPEPPFKKLIACLRESFSGFILEAVIVFVPVAFILQLSVIDTLMCILARISFALLFTAGHILVERVFGTVVSKILVFVFYFGTLLLLCVPGILTAVLLTSLNLPMLTENVAILLALAVCNIPIALLVCFLCRNMLQYAELNNR